MTNTHAIQTTEDEEKFLLEQLLGARHGLELHKKETSARRFQQNILEKELEVIEQAVADYMTGNGVKQFEAGHCTITISETESVDAPDVDAIPEQFVRTKITKEPNKILIKELRPEGANWYSLKQGFKLTVKEQ